jgi:2,3-bisphosphoglycerate-independent phosphoglycerate mutase
VPFIVAGQRFAGRSDVLAPGEHGLADIAPTVLKILGLPQPAEMTGQSIIA